MTIYTIYSLEVSGNADDGYEVNDRRRIGTIEVYDDIDNKDLLAVLDAEDYVFADRSKVSDESDDATIFVDSSEDGRPLLQLDAEPS